MLHLISIGTLWWVTHSGWRLRWWRETNMMKKLTSSAMASSYVRWGCNWVLCILYLFMICWWSNLREISIGYNESTIQILLNKRSDSSFFPDYWSCGGRPWLHASLHGLWPQWNCFPGQLLSRLSRAILQDCLHVL